MSDVQEKDYEYYAHFIYNKPKLKNLRSTNPDWVVSFEVVKFAVDLMARWGYKRTYYHDRDATPGETILDEFFSAVAKSKYIIVIITRGFIKDLWSKYKSQSALLQLLESDKIGRFIAIYINLQNENDIPPEMKPIEPLTFGCDWKTDWSEWKKLKRLISRPTLPITDSGPDNYTASATSSNLEVNKEPSGYSSSFHAVQGSDIGTDSPVSMDMETMVNVENYSESQRSKNTDSKCSVLIRSKSSHQDEIFAPRQNRQQYAQNEEEKSTDSGLDTSSLLGSIDNSAIGTDFFGKNSLCDATIQVGRDDNHQIQSKNMEASLNGEIMSHSQRSQNTDPKRSFQIKPKSSEQEKYLHQSHSRQQCAEKERDKSTEKRTIPVVGGDDQMTLSQEETSPFKKNTDLITIKDNKISLARYGLKCIGYMALYIWKADQSFFKSGS